MKRLAVTGPLAAGKSVISHWFQQRGAYCVSADAIVSQYLDIRHPIGQKLVDLLGVGITSAGSFELNRKALAGCLFNDLASLKAAEKIIHPEVLSQIKQEFQSVPTSAACFIAEVPLLYEVGWQNWFDAVLFVDASEPLRLERYLQRPGTSVEDFTARQNHLLDNNKKKALADYIVDTSKSSFYVSKQLDSIWRHFLSLN